MKLLPLCSVLWCLSCGSADVPVPQSAAVESGPVEKENEGVSADRSPRTSACTWFHTNYRKNIHISPEGLFPIPADQQAVFPASWGERGIEITEKDVKAADRQITAELAAAYRGDPASKLLIRSHDGAADCILDYINYYHAQYFGWKSNGRRELIVQFFLILPEPLWDAESRAERLQAWREGPYSVRGGGPAYWTVHFDLETGYIESISINSGR